MSDDEPAEQTQKTRPKKGEPLEIPIPTREDFLRDLRKVAPPAPKRSEPDEEGEPR
jgi:hypothetical protein